MVSPEGVIDYNNPGMALKSAKNTIHKLWSLDFDETKLDYYCNQSTSIVVVSLMANDAFCISNNIDW